MSHPIHMTVGEIAQMLGRSVSGDSSVVINGFNAIDQAEAGELTFLGSDTFAKYLATTRASCVIVREADQTRVASPAWIVSPSPYADMMVLMQMITPRAALESGRRDASAHIDDNALVDASAAIGPGCVVSAGCRIGPNSQLLANVVLYPNVAIGADSVVHANVTIYGGTEIGNRCTIHAGTVIGSDGFGYREQADKCFEKIPHVGTVCIGNDVEIGANVAIDRAAMGRTVIEDGVKIDNLVQIAHGVRIGEHTAIAAHVAVAGGTTLGRRNRLAGQSGVVGHIETADDVVVYAQAGVAKSITKPGAYFGSPAKEHGLALRMEMALRQLPDLLHQVRTLSREIEELKEERQK